MNPLDFLHLQLMRLEGLEIVNGNRLRQVAVVPGEEMPLVVLAQLVDGQVVPYLDESLDQDLCQELMGQTQLIQFPTITPLIEILDAQHIPFRVGHYKTYLFPAAFLNFVSNDVKCCSKEDPRVRHFGFGDFAEQVHVIERDGRIVSACVSTREDKGCGEAWVCTDPQYRHHGLTRQVVSPGHGTCSQSEKSLSLVTRSRTLLLPGWQGDWNFCLRLKKSSFPTLVLHSHPNLH